MKYFINTDIDALKTASPLEREQIARRLAACIGDEATLRNILGLAPEEFADFYPDVERPDLSTADTISTFISLFSSEKKAEAPTIEALVPEIPIAPPAIDYAASMEMQHPDDADQSPADETDSVIASFLNEMPPKRPVRKPAQYDMTDFSRAVKEHDYKAALEIITRLSLNNPKKSVYFASQMRFLKKLIKIEEYSTR